MAGQANRKNWDGIFRFPRHHFKGRSLQEFSRPELIYLRNYCNSVWEVWWKKASMMSKKSRPDWPSVVAQTHETHIEVTKELWRRH